MNVRHEGDAIHLERLVSAHAEAFAGMAAEASEVAGRWLGSDAVPDGLEATTRYIERLRRDWESGTRHGLVAVETEGGRLAGFGFLNSLNRRHLFANVGYWVRPDASGRGYATSIARLLAPFGFNELGLARVEFVIEPDNVASKRVAEKAGAMCEGLLRCRLQVNGEAKDALMYSVVKQPAA